MKVCILGDGLTSLTLAKSLVNLGIFVDVYIDKKIKKIDKSRTIGISKSNVDFFNKHILNIEKLIWDIDKIEIYSCNLKNERVLNFESDKKQLFSIVRNFELYNLIFKNLKKNNFFNLKRNAGFEKLLKKDYKIIINCDPKNILSKKFFYKKINKNYNSHAHTAIIHHKKFINNNTATQIFTNLGPLAFLPISEKETSVVYSVRNLRDINLKKIINKFNSGYSITKINDISKFELKSSSLRNYKYKNILAFGDLLHRLHPLAGQGFNMTLRDVRFLSELFKFRLDHGLEIDSSICVNFEKKMRHKNYLFSNGIDLIYESFNFENKFKNSMISRSAQFLGKNKYINNFFKNFANTGINI
tara:strand:- start:6699 stop:7772 length:1074 start_codon:yes stop_codon:yes gene_type:complete